MSQNQNLHSLTKLTEFARDFENQPETLLGRFVNKIQNAYNHSYNTMNVISSSNRISNTANSFNSNTSSNTADTTNIVTDNCLNSANLATSEHNKPQSPLQSNAHNSDAANTEYQIQEDRTMVNVLLRIRNLVTAKNTVGFLF